MQMIKHLLIKIAGLLIIIGIPMLMFTNVIFGDSNKTDVVSSATTVISDDISGEYIVLINESLHKKADSTADWKKFFSGESPVIFDDINCLVADSDIKGIEFAQVCRSRLPENQMKLNYINGLLLVSKAEYEKIDTVIMSKEFAENFNAADIGSRDGITVLYCSNPK